MIYTEKSKSDVFCRNIFTLPLFTYNADIKNTKKQRKGGAAVNRSFLDKLNIKNSLKYKLMFAAGGSVHLAFFFIFLFLHIYPLVFINIFSILLYLFGVFFSVDKKTGYMRYGWMIAFYSEIIIHSLISTVYIGIESSFQLYAITVLPLAIYVLFFSCKIEKFLLTMGVFITVCVVSLVGVTIAVEELEMIPLYPLTYGEIHLFRSLNLTFSGILLVAFSMLFALEIHGLINRLNDINHKLEHTATHDALTGLYNRHSLKPVFDTLKDSNDVFCIALGDIDNFKKVNDTYGHGGGDEVLKMVASSISNGIGEEDIACRWGGEEILIIFHGDRKVCSERMDKIREDINSRTAHHDGKNIKATMTFGFIECNNEKDIEECISIADKRLYKGKTSGKNVIVYED